MGLLSLAINDDAAERDSTGAVDLTGTTAVFSASSTLKQHVGFRVVNVTVPNGATIRHAYLKVYCSSMATAGTTNITVKGQAADNAGVFTNGAGDLSGRTLTTASTATLISDLDNRYLSIDVTAIVQEIVNRAGWVSGNAIVFMFFSPPATTTCTFDMLEGTNVPSAGIIYDDSEDSARPPSVSGTGAYTNPDNAFSSNGVYATLDNSVNGQQIWESFNIANLAGSTILGILVKVEAKVSSDANRSCYKIELSWDGGTTWTTAKTAEQFGTADLVRMYGGADQWSHAFIPAELTNANFKLRLTNDFATASNDASVDFITVQTFYAAATASIPNKIVFVKQAVNRASTY